MCRDKVPCYVFFFLFKKKKQKKRFYLSSQRDLRAQTIKIVENKAAIKLEKWERVKGKDNLAWGVSR